MRTAFDHRLKLLIHGDLQHAASREMLGGILRFAATQHEWEVQIEGGHPSHAAIEFYRNWQPDALITHAYAHTLPLDEYKALAGKLAFFVNSTPRKTAGVSCATLTSDDEAIATTAGKFLLAKGLRSYAYVGAINKESWDERRQRFFRAFLKNQGQALHVFKAPDSNDWRQQEEALARWLASLPKPCGLFASYDQRAKHVLDACRVAKINVPDQIKVIGVDNESYICEQTVPRLSSISPNYEAAGYAMFEVIDKVLKGQIKPHAIPPMKIGLRGIVERESSSDSNGTSHRILRARDFIRDHASVPIGIEDIAKAAGVSRRTLEIDFKRITGNTIHDELQNRRLEIAKDMLRHTSTKIDAIPSFCGLRSPAHLKILFKKTFGLTMGAYRNASEGQSSTSSPMRSSVHPQT